MTLVATQVKRRRGTTAENDAFTGAEGEITVDLGNKELRVHTGDNKAGGYGVARKDFKNLTDEAKNIGNWSSNVSNCITYIPQDIKLELNNGTLTLKAGSKVCIPNGPSVFDITTIQSDKVLSGGSATGRELVYLTISGILIHYLDNSSGSDWNATSQYQCRYNTSANMIKNTNNTGSTWETQLSFPLAIITLNNGVVQSIDQVFNGFGYIGSTVFALPGVKGLIPNGRNEDGSLKNIEVTLDSVKTNTTNGTGINLEILLKLTNGTLELRTTFLDTIYYNANNNHVIQNGIITTEIMCGNVLFDSNSKITSFTPKTAFHAVDYNDTEYIAHQATPSNRIVTLTLPATGKSIVAPADGYIVFRKTTGGENQYIELVNLTFGKYTGGYSSGAGIIGAYCSVTCPVSKGDRVYIGYNATGATDKFQFVYANGAQ